MVFKMICYYEEYINNHYPIKVQFDIKYLLLLVSMNLVFIVSVKGRVLEILGISNFLL